jgi:phospholipid/cholesterol/gamma-HCH transport system substrate-binding protein
VIPQSTRAGFWERVANSIRGYLRWMTHEGRVLINVVLFLLISLVLIYVLVVSVFRVQDRYEIVATFEESGSVFTGQEVTYRGVTVGRVGNLRVVREGVEMLLVIESRYDEIPKDGTQARVMFKSAVGEQFVDLLPTKRTAPFFAHGDKIAKKDTQLPVQQEDLLRLLDSVLSGVPPESIGNLVDVLGEGLRGRGDDLRRALAAVDPLTKTLASRTGELNSLAVSGDAVGTAFDATSSEFVSGIKGLGDVAGALGRGSEGLSRLLTSGAEFVPDLGSLIAARKAQLDTTIANLAEITRISADHLQSVEDTLDWLPLLLDTLVEAYDPGTNRFRFGQILGELGSPPCSYGTPRRNAQATGNAPYHPILDFDC